MIKIPDDADARSPEREQFLHDYGVILALWSQFDTYIEVAIMRLTGMSGLHASVVLGTLQSKAKCNILYSLLRLNDDEMTAQKVKEAIDFAKRNLIVHSAMASEKDFSKIVFFKRSIDPRYKAVGHNYSADSFHEHVWKFRDLANEALTALSLTEADLNEYGRMAQLHGIDE